MPVEKELDKRYIVGIDLGTTNSAVSCVDLASERKKDADAIRIFRTPQLTAPGEFAGLPVLPSFLYISGEYDIAQDAVTIPWDKHPEHFVGAFARDHGAHVPARLVSSAKSWLCHSKADRRSRILPWGSGEEVYKISPVDATAAYLAHIRRAWNSTLGEEADLYLENQVVIVTVPASFDEVARDLTVEAAAKAGLENVTLLEEPLAAFYNWLIRHEKDWDDHVQPGELILVCDVGGGTTDFTLITLREAEGSPRFERIAVGDHLLLGGDNIDLALARQVERKFSGKRQSLSTDRWKALCHQCRQAKEAILDGDADERKITLMGKGRKLIAETLSATLDRSAVEGSVLEGFFPLVASDAASESAARKGITEFGLPYEQDPAITRHLGRFLERHRDTVAATLDRENPGPDLILFNGGSLKAEVVQERIRAAVRHWFDIDDAAVPRIMENPSPDLAVSLGAAYYGLVKMGQGVRVGSGSARAYYLGVETGDAKATQRRDGAICLVERGLDEGSRIDLPDRKFEVLANQPVAFDVYSSSYRSGDRCGDIIGVDDSLTPLPPIQTVIQYGKKGIRTAIPVGVAAEYTEMGTLALWCRSHVSDHRWRLQFQLRDAATAPAEAMTVSEENVFDESLVADLRGRVGDAFAEGGDPKRLDGLVKEIAAAVDRPKKDWPLGLIRRLADALLAVIDRRKASVKAESRWLNLTGFCLRPGLGEGFDPHRMKTLWKIYKNGPIHANNPQVRSEWWILWRRVAGGLQPGQQRQFTQELSPVMLPKKGSKPKKKLPPQEHLEMWMAAAGMEQLLVKEKAKWGNGLAAELDPKKARPQHFWSLSRIGARELLYGPVDRVVPPDAVMPWIDRLLKTGWASKAQRESVVPALIQMTRKTGDRSRDLPADAVDRVVGWLKENGVAEDALRPLRTVTALARQEESAIFGDSLPGGLVLRDQA